ncbi:CHAT domain-containing protein, partial [candidate division KSB1 bacterium]|nr:CHAT domain-containing protein [candidate division KSB1 bacterium]
TLKKTTATTNNMLVVADPVFTANDSRLNLLAQAKMSENKVNLMGALVDWKQMGVKGVRSKETQRDAPADASAIFPRLEKTAALAKALESLFGRNAVVFSGSEAKEDKVRAADLSQYRYLTFATHGILDRAVPYIKEPALVLTQVDNPEGYDGFLTMTEVMGLKLNAEVVALTACETGVGKNVSGEGVMGMGRAFQYAGAQNVLVSLWSVAETSATQLTSTFYKYIKEGQDPKQAIRLARNDIRRLGYEHPFYWGAFILFGE